jgi:hypothetical protein
LELKENKFMQDKIFWMMSASVVRRQTAVGAMNRTSYGNQIE